MTARRVERFSSVLSAGVEASIACFESSDRREELAELRRKSSVAQAQLEAAGEQAKEVESLRAELTELRQESAVAKTQLEAAGEQAKEVESLRAELTELRQKSAVAKTHLEAAEEQAKEVESLRAELTELRQKSAVAQTQLEAAGEQAKKVESLRTELTELRQKSAVAQAQLEAAGEQAKKVESLRAELQELKHKPEVDQEALRAKDRAAAVAELHGQATHAALSRREEASRRCFASQLAAHYEQLLVLALRAWRGATAQELSLRDAAAEVEQLRREMQGLKQDLAHKAQPSKVVEPEAADFVWQFLEAPNPLPDVVAGASTETVGLPKPTDFAESAVQLALLRREEAQRRLLASLLSSQLVAVLSLAFRAWQNAQDASGMERQALLQKDELQKLRTQLEQQKEAPSALRYLHRAFAAWREDQAAEALERLAAQHARELELQRAELARPTENEATQRLTRAADTRAMQEEAERERLLLVSFLTWREDKVANAATLAAQRHGREMDRLRTQLQSQTAGLSDCTPESREEKRLRAELAELKSREEAFILQTQRDKEAEKAALCDRAAELAMARREEAARGLLSSLLAWRLESLLSDAFGAWQSLQGARKREEQSREVAELRSALQAAQTSNLRREEARLREEQSKEVAELRPKSKLSATTPAGDEAAREAAESSRFALEEMAVALFYQQRAGAMSKALSFALCGQLELFLAGAFLEWRRAVLDERKGRQRAVSLESVEQFIAPPHAPNQLAVPAASPSPSRSSSKNEAARWEDWDMDPDYEPEL
ncbi:unnamed protein product [Effrenium voratum]|uniref:Uncharacterized protein n=1 Tax=Effrenium voratum TaxID=2562239 RepID=A0AA36IN72_9DINO|nr:unnamed protein product [Effrenium voratum]